MAAITKQRLLEAEDRAKEAVMKAFEGANPSLVESVAKAVIYNINKNLKGDTQNDD